MFKPKVRHVRQSQVEKFTRYSIRKVSFGAASVAVATGLFFLGGGSVQAAEPVTNPESTEVQNLNGKSPDPSKEVAGQVSATAKVAEGQNNTSVKESATDKQASEVETPTVVTEKADINTASLEDLVAKVESRLSQLTEGKKTKSVIDDAKNLVHKAKELLNDDTKTQAKVDALAKQLSSSLVILNSIKSEVTEEEKVNKNQDPRNGQAIPGNGESGFREAAAQETPLADVAGVSEDELTKAKQELQAEITKLTDKISTEEAKGKGKINKEFVELLNEIKVKSETIYNEVANLTTEKEKHAVLQKLKAQKDTLLYYRLGKVDWGAPINNNAVRFGNNNETGVFANLKEGFGEQNFSSAISKQKDSGPQQLGPATNSPIVGSAKYHWKELELTREQAADGTKLNGWKLTNNTEKVTLVKGESPTNITPQPNQNYTPKPAKLYSNNDKVTATGGQNRPNAGGGMLSGLISAEDMKKVGLGRVDRDYYLELGKKGNGIYRDVDVNPNSLLFVNVLHNGAYGPLALTSEGENVKLTIVDAYTGQKLTELNRKNGNSKNEFEQNPSSVGNGWRNLLRAVHIPEGTTKVRVTVEAGSPGQTNKTLGNNPIEDGYIIGGIGIATGPAVNISTNITSEKKSGKYGFTDDTIYGKKQTGTIDLNIRNLGGASITGFQTKYKVTIKVPKGVVLGTLNANGKTLDLNQASGQAAWELNNTWTSDFRFDKIKSELSFLVDSSRREIVAGDNRKSDFIVKIPFETTADYVGSSTFEVSGQNGFPGDDSLGNVLHKYGNNDSNFYDVPENVNAPSLKYSNEPNYKYKKTLYIDSLTDVDKITVPVGTSLDKIKELSKLKAKEKIESEEYKRKLDETSATATLDDQGTSTGVVATDVAKENAGVIKVPVVHSRDGKNYKNTVDIEVNVVKSTTDKLVVFEGDKITNEEVKSSVKPATIDNNLGVVNNPNEADVINTTGKAGEAGLKIPTTVTHEINGTNINETVEVPVTVLPKATPQGIIVAKDSDKEKAKEKALTKAKEAIADGTFRGKLPANVTNVSIDENVDNPDLSDDTDVNVTVKYMVDGEEKRTVVKVPVTVVEGVPQIVPVDENNKQPNPENSIDKTEYPEGSTFEYDPKSPVDTTTPGDYTVNVIVKDKEGNPIAEVPATVRVVESYPQFVPVDKDKKQPAVEGSIDPKAFPKDTEFTYETPVDTTTPGEKDVVVVAKIGDKVIAKVPAKVMVVEPKTQYVPVDKSNKQPDASKSIDPEQYPDEITFGYKTPVDTTTPGEKDVVVVAKDGDDTLVEVPTKVKVVQGYPQIVPVDEGKKQPSPEDSIDSNDYPDDATFEYKEEVDTSKPGDKKVTVVVKQGDKVLVEVPATVRVVESYPQFVPVDKDNKQPAVEGSIDPKAFPKDTEFTYETPVDTTTPGEKDVTVVAKLNGQPIAEVPAKVVVVDPKTQYVVADPSKPQPDASKSIDPEQYPEGTTFEYKTPVDTTTPGEKDVVVVAKDGEDKLVEVPTKVKVVQGYPQIVPVDEGKKQPSPEDSIDSNDYPDDATFEYKEEVDTSTPGDKKVTVVVKQGDKVLVEVPSTVRVVESYPKYVPVDPAKKQPDPKENINPNDFPTGTTFEYKDNTPVDTATPGEKDVTVVAKLNGQPITEIPAKIVVVESKTQYVPVNAENDKKPKPQDSITPDDYPEGSTFEYKTPEGQTTPYDGTTPGEKDVTVVVKDPDGDTIVEVPAKIKVVQGKEQLTPVNAEDKDKPKAEDSITPSDYPEGSTFEYKVPEGQTTPYDGTTPGDKPVTVVVKDKDGKVLVEVPATIKVVETKPTPIETPVTNTPLTEDDYTKGMKIPEGATVKVGDLPDLTTPGEKTPVKVTITLPNGKSYTVDVPVTVTPVKEIETPVTTTPLTPDDYTKGIKIPEGGKVTNVENIPDLTTPGKKDPVKVTVTLPNGKVVTVDVPVTVTPVKEIETPVTTTPLTPDDYTKGITIPEGGKVTKVENIPDLTTPGKKDPVKVTIELPNGKVITVEVPVIVTPKSTPTPRPEKPSTTEVTVNPEKSKATVVKEGEKVLPNTGIADDNSTLAGLGLAILGLVGLVRRRKQK